MIDDASFERRGFLPSEDPLACFLPDSPYLDLDEWGQQLPDWLQQSGFREFAKKLLIPPWQHPVTISTLPMLRLYYLRLGFLASGYINQVGEKPIHGLPANLAQPLCHVCELLGRPPILSYDGYALFNWYRLNPDAPIELGNIATIQNFVELYDEHWFILVHVEIEALAAASLKAICGLADKNGFGDPHSVNTVIQTITETVNKQTAVLQRIPERMSPDLYFKAFRPYIRFFEQVTYEGTQQGPMDYRGETGAQSSVIPSLVAFFKIPHQATALTEHLRDLRRYMPIPHRQLLERIEAMPAIKPIAAPEIFTAALDAIARFREVHFGWAQQYIDDKVEDPRGTGGTPYMKWLAQLIQETRAFGQ